MPSSSPHPYACIHACLAACLLICTSSHILSSLNGVPSTSGPPRLARMVSGPRHATWRLQQRPCCLPLQQRPARPCGHAISRAVLQVAGTAATVEAALGRLQACYWQPLMHTNASSGVHAKRSYPPARPLPGWEERSLCHQALARQSIQCSCRPTRLGGLAALARLNAAWLRPQSGKCCVVGRIGLGDFPYTWQCKTLATSCRVVRGAL